MNKHTIIASVAIIVIIMPFAYSVLNIHVAENIQYKWENEEKFNFFAMSNGGIVEFCNTVPMWANIKGFQVDVFYDMRNLGAFSINSINMDPSSSTTQHGRFVSDKFIEAQHVFMTLDHEFDGGDIRLDPTKMYVLVTMNTPILGFIPYTVSSQYTGFDFDIIMKGDGFEC